MIYCVFIEQHVKVFHSLCAAFFSSVWCIPEGIDFSRDTERRLNFLMLDEHTTQHDVASSRDAQNYYT